MLKNVIIALLAIALIGGATTVAVWSQAQTAEVEVRVRAKRLDDGRTEFAVQQRDGSGWSDSLFARNPRLTATPVVDRWYSSRGVIASAPVDAASLMAAARPSPPVGWTPLGDTGGDVRIGLEYSVEANVISSEMTTTVAVFARDDGEYIKLGMTCEGRVLNLIVDDSTWSYSDSAQVTLRFGSNSPRTYTWALLRGAETGYSPSNDRDFIASLRAADQVAVQVESDAGTTALLVDLAGFFTTPAQPNLDHCGGATPSGVSLLGDTRGEVSITVEYAVREDLEDGSLTTIVETWVTDDSYDTSWVYLVCDRDRLDVVLQVADNTYTTPSRTPTTTVRIDDGVAEEFRWPYIRGVKHGISPDNDLEFVERIRDASSLEVRVDRGTAAEGTTFALAGLLKTRAQANVDFCGQY